MLFQQLLPVVAGFLLTTVLGGLLGVLFQRRTWNHQHRVQSAERERDRAVAIFEEVSRLLDKRLYRARLLHWRLREDRDEDDDERLASAMAGYREVLTEWNDGINRNLALLQQYFGERIRADFDNNLGARFVQVGKSLERRWAHRDDLGGRDDERLQIGSKLDEVANVVYYFNLKLIRSIQAGEVGRAIAESSSREPGSRRRSRGSTSNAAAG